MTQFMTNRCWEVNLRQATTCQYPEGARLMGVQLYTEKNSWIWSWMRAMQFLENKVQNEKI